MTERTDLLRKVGTDDLQRVPAGERLEPLAPDGQVRMIEVGAVRIYLGDAEETMQVLRALVRPLSMKEMAALLRISERTLRRWRRAGRLPAGDRTPLTFTDLLSHLAPGEAG